MGRDACASRRSARTKAGRLGIAPWCAALPKRRDTPERHGASYPTKPPLQLRSPSGFDPVEEVGRDGGTVVDDGVGAGRGRSVGENGGPVGQGAGVFEVLPDVGAVSLGDLDVVRLVSL